MLLGREMEGNEVREIDLKRGGSKKKERGKGLGERKRKEEKG
jgi:hypothetical protein